MIDKTKALISEKKLPVLILKNIVLFPKNIAPVLVGRTGSTFSVETALTSESKEVIVVLQKNIEKDSVAAHDLYMTGTRATLLQVVKTTKNGYKVLLEGIERVTIENYFLEDNDWQATYKGFNETSFEHKSELEAFWRSLRKTYQEYIAISEMKLAIDLIPEDALSHEMEIIVDTLSMQAPFKPVNKQKILEFSSLKDRIAFVTLLLKTEIEIFKTEERIQKNVQAQIETTQREYYLHEQLKAIEKELKSEKKDNKSEDFKKLAKKSGMPEEAYERVEREVARLEHMQMYSAEATVSRSYLEWLTALPWNKESKDKISIAQSEELLEKRHFGIKKVKERILEFVSAKKFAQNLTRTPVICLVGPPGVGKTSLGQSIAETLGREFIRISLGGVRDEAEIRGHRKTYIGAMPGKIIQGMRKAKTINPVFLLDEIDKISSDIHGDPASALLEVLDPEQNNTFCDNYLEVAYDLSKVIFIATANSIEPIPHALFDRMEVISISGYTKKEKHVIAQKFLIPKQMKEHNLNLQQCLITDQALDTLISEYTRESGVRNLERLLIRVLQKTIKKLLADKNIISIVVNPEIIKEYFRSAPYKNKIIDTFAPKIGIATGLAWTELGGDILEIEVALIPGKGNITLTGQLGEIMQESAQAAISYLKARMKILKIAKKFFTQYDIHIHVPEGATPKDGPSAGITICTALASALMNVPVKAKIAMTGEITLQGRVLAVGGIKEKALAAQAYGCNTIIIPEEIKELALEELEELDGNSVSLMFVQTMDDVLAKALTVNPFARKQKRSNSASI